MATPIKDTPIISGDDAKRFRESLRETVKPWETYTNSEKKTICEEQDTMEQAYKLMVSISDERF
ncbi:hypothetical protein FACS189437_07980 [Bacteroidia bacterium]|nr:hypothetical protein FACS189437_07980 [Bacteroidia bacterium]